MRSEASSTKFPDYHASSWRWGRSKVKPGIQSTGQIQWMLGGSTKTREVPGQPGKSDLWAGPARQRYGCGYILEFLWLVDFKFIETNSQYCLKSKCISSALVYPPYTMTLLESPGSSFAVLVTMINWAKETLLAPETLGRDQCLYV